MKLIIFINFLKQIHSGFDYLEIYDGGSEYSDLMANMTGMHNQTKISVPGNQMFITFESNSTTFAKKGFRAFIDKIGIQYYQLIIEIIAH